jgi:hypothetical protein
MLGEGDRLERAAAYEPVMYSKKMMVHEQAEDHL